MRSESLRILLVEYDPVDAELMQKTLLESGGKFLVHHSEDLDAAELTLSETGVDLLLMSLSLRGGLADLTRIRSHYPKLPIVIMTGLDDTFFALKAVREGAQDYLVKGQTSRGLLVRTLRYAIERKRAEDELRYRLEFEKLIATISTHFINIAHDQIDRGISRALQAIGEFAAVDRCYLFQFDKSSTTMSNTHEWCAASIESRMAQRKEILLSSYQWITEKLRRAESVHIDRVAELPMEAAQEKHSFGRAGVVSLVCAPMIHRGEVVGFLGFDAVTEEKKWPEDIESLLKIAGDMFVNALQLKQFQQELLQSQERLKIAEERYHYFFQEDSAAHLICAVNGQVLECNESLYRMFGLDSKSEAFGAGIQSLFRAGQEWDELVSAIRSARIVPAIDTRMRKTDGSEIIVRIHAAGGFNDNGDLVEVRAIFSAPN